MAKKPTLEELRKIAFDLNECVEDINEKIDLELDADELEKEIVETGEILEDGDRITKTAYEGLKNLGIANLPEYDEFADEIEGPEKEKKKPKPKKTVPKKTVPKKTVPKKAAKPKPKKSAPKKTAVQKKTDVKKSVFGHKIGSQAEAIDNALLKGGTLEELAKTTKTSSGRVKSHIKHLVDNKGIKVNETKSGVFKAPKNQ